MPQGNGDGSSSGGGGVGGGGGGERGAANLFQTYEAENSTCTGKIIGPTYAAYTDTAYLPSEASQRLACQLQTLDQYVEFVLTAPATGFNLRYSIPDAPQGNGLTMMATVGVNGAEVGALELTSAYSWYYGKYPFVNKPSAGSPHHFYNEGRFKFRTPVKAGAKIRIAIASKSLKES
eukprot:UC1_evm1s228